MCEIDDRKSSPTKPTSTSTATTASSKPTRTIDPTASTITSPSDPKFSPLYSECSSTAAGLSMPCPSYPSKAVLAGFFPGAIFGAVLAALGMFCFRRWQRRQIPPSIKVVQHTQRSSNGTLLGISSPIPTDDSSYRTDFLLRRSRSSKRSSEGARSMLQRTGTRVKSLFGSTPKITVHPPPEKERPKVPPLPVTPPQKIRPQRLPSTESIRVYTPPGVFAGTGVLKPDPYPAFRLDTTFADMMDQVGFSNNKGDPSYRVTDTSQESSNINTSTLRVPRRS
ncbi:hypothetical protein EYZ11_004067 [Aspergillus tanneri]|uniref:Transmembrane protein n=1 Tax=Aspergillus tanneri TaxID=1220188 RepID=A0A4S3JLL8_9EURO|nr:uncharacterized protein ATNIH1004_006133 [Aspergillus tanneri]KAA8647440.1 hypothetical protein ATNIH1004_006133 [Aspergillus tanneri]THC96476.1 hypothetical protein EYZ11_004067 [Aspergillus tanneri]